MKASLSFDYAQMHQEDFRWNLPKNKRAKGRPFLFRRICTATLKGFWKNVFCYIFQCLINCLEWKSLSLLLF